MALDLVRITHPLELLAVQKEVKPLFEKYCNRTKKYMPDMETGEIAWENAVTKSIFPDYYLYLIKDDGKFVGFYIGNLFRLPGFTVLYTVDFYIPGKGNEFRNILKAITKILGADEIWGEAPENIYRVYRRNLKGATIKKAQVVRIKL
jgi:hypothetical protein